MVGVAGFEPATLWSQTRCATRLRYTPEEVLIQHLFFFSMYKDMQNKGFLIRICYIKHMIIVCPSCKKKFEVDTNQIPENGRMLKCGSCNQTWFYNNVLDNNYQIKLENEFTEEISTENIIEKKQNLSENSDKKENNQTEIKLKKTNSFSLSKILSYLIVVIISFVAVILVIETFKSQLINIFPGLELMLYNLFESIKDVVLFIKDLSV